VAAPEVLKKVGRYEVIREVGRGGMAVVYLARQTDLDRDVALKELGAFHAADPAFAERFLRESRVAGSLSHPNIVTVHDYFEHERIPFISMEYLERGSLRPFVGRLTLEQIAGVLESVLAALAHAEIRGIVHRDLKPENLMVTGHGGVKIADFGIAKALNQAQSRFLTATGTTVGTPTYMAPEQAMAKNIGPWTDLYATGVIAYELLCGKVPFHDTDTPMAILLRQVNDPIPSPLSVKPDLDPRLADWLEKLLAKNPEDRIPSALEAWDQLEEIVISICGARWRRAARIVEGAEDEVVTPEPLTPAPFHEDSGVAPVTPPEAAEAAPAPPASPPPAREPDEADEAFATFQWGRPPKTEPAPAAAVPPTVPPAATPTPPEAVPTPEPEPPAEPADLTDGFKTYLPRASHQAPPAPPPVEEASPAPSAPSPPAAPPPPPPRPAAAPPPPPPAAPTPEPATDEQATVLPSAIAPQDQTFEWPAGEKERKRRINPLLVGVALAVVAIGVGAFVLLSGGKSSKKAQASPPPAPPPAAPTGQGPKTKPHASMPQAKRVLFLGQGRNVVVRISFAGAMIMPADVKVVDANMSDGTGVVTILQKGVMSDVEAKAGKGIKLSLAAAGSKLTITATAASGAFTKVTATAGATGKAVALTFVRKPKPKPVVINPPAVVPVSPPPAVSPPPVAQHTPTVAQSPPPPPSPPPSPPPAQTILGGG
jgi:hypothetical protein